MPAQPKPRSSLHRTVERFKPYKDVIEWVGALIAVGTFIALAVGALPGLGSLDREWLILILLCIAEVAAVAVGIRVFVGRHGHSLASALFSRRNLRAVSQEMRSQLPAGSVANRGVELGNYLDVDGLYVDPPYESSEPNGDHVDLVERLVDALSNGQHVIVTGEAGLGKSLLTQIVFARLAARAATSLRAPFPTLVRMSTLEIDDSDDWIEVLLRSSLQQRGLSRSRIARLHRHRKLVILLDALDEVPVAARNPTTGGLATAIKALIESSSLLTSRQTFFDIVLAGSSMDATFDLSVSLLEHDFEEQTSEFVRRFCKATSDESPDRILELIRASPRLRDLVRRPLLAFMVCDVLLHDHRHLPKDASAALVYRRYCVRWLQLEAQKSNLPQLDWEKKTEWSRFLAWRVFKSTGASLKAYGSVELTDLTLPRSAVDEAAREFLSEIVPASAVPDHIEDLVSRSFLVRRSADSARYQFVHKSFFEYFLADWICIRIACLGDDVLGPDGPMESPLPDPVINFFRDMLRDSPAEGGDAPLERGLARIAERPRDRALTPPSADRSTTTEPSVYHGSQAYRTARQQAANLMAAVAGQDTVRRLKEMYMVESDPFVRRGIAVGLALEGRSHEELEDFVETMRRDPESLACHLGYNKVYYGDTSSSSDWLSNPAGDCRRLLTASMRQLSLERYRALWPMALFTVRVLLTSDAESGRQVLEQDDDLRQALGVLLAELENSRRVLSIDDADVVRQVLGSLEPAD